MNHITTFVAVFGFLWPICSASAQDAPVRTPPPVPIPADPQSIYSSGAFQEVVVDEDEKLYDLRPYGGVVPGRLEPEEPGIPPKGNPQIDRVGFEQRELFSRVFVVVDRATTPWVYDNFVQCQANPAVPCQIFAEFASARMSTKNDRRPLVTRAFNTPVALVESVKTKEGIRIVITLKREARYLPVQADKVLYIDVER
jgi:hypothetical protein